MSRFGNRSEAGKELAKKLVKYKGKSDVIVIGLPRGGVVTAFTVAKALDLPLDIIVTRKLGAPFQEELAIGSITENGEPILNKEIIQTLDITNDYINNKIQEEKKEATRRIKEYRGNKPALDLSGMSALIIDDGIATGYTMHSAINYAKDKGAKSIIVATPVIARDTLNNLKNVADEIVYVHKPLYFGAVGEFYKEFDQTSDEEVKKLLKL